MNWKQFAIVGLALYLFCFFGLWLLIARHTGVVLLLPFLQIAFTALQYSGVIMLFVLLMKVPRALRS